MGIPLQLHLESKLYLRPDQGILPFFKGLSLVEPTLLLKEDLVVEASTCQLQASESCDQRGGCVSRVLVVDGWSTVDP